MLLISVHMCAHQGLKNVSFSENLTYVFRHFSKHFSTSKNLELSYESQSYNVFLVCFKSTLERFSIIFSYSLVSIITNMHKESSLYLPTQRFFKTPHKILKFQAKSKKNAFSNDLQTESSKSFPLVSTIRSPGKEIEALVENDCRQKCLAKTLLLYFLPLWFEDRISLLFSRFHALVVFQEYWLLMLKIKLLVG